MRCARSFRPALLNLVVALAVGLSGCGDNDPATGPQPQPDPLPPGTPLNDTPANTLTRFVATYENQVLDQYELLLTSNFRFTFSNQSDPALVSQYGDNWRKNDEVASTSHLFDGFLNSQGDFLNGASGIMLDLPGVQVVADPDHADSTAHYKLAIVPTISLLLDIPGTDGFEIAAPHDFYLVRGDAAVVDTGQPADTTRWYIRRQVDKSPSIALRAPSEFAPARVLPASPSTWGSVKATYHH